jgi:hypothetical protein
MKQTKKHNVLRVFLIEATILVVIVGIAALGYIFRTPFKIAYHRNRENAASAGIRRSRASEGSPDYGKRLQHHREALLALGYRQEHIFRPRYLRDNTPEAEQLRQEFRRKCPSASFYSISVGWETGLWIEDIPERIPVWEELINKYDIPSADPCQPAAAGNREQAPGS